MAITNEPFDSQACGIDYVISHRYGDGAIIWGYVRKYFVEKIICATMNASHY
jgi:hypothetical protein